MSSLGTPIRYVVLLLIAGPQAAWAQDPFARPAAAGAPPAAQEPQDVKTPSALAQAIVDSLPITRRELARAIKILLDLDEDQLAKGYLNTLAAQNADPSEWARLLESMGSDFFVLLSTRASLQPEGKQLADRVFDAAWRHASDPARIDQLIRGVNDADIYARSEAYNELAQLGQLGAAAVLTVFADPSRSDEFPMLRTALRKMGAEAEGPLLGAARASNPQVQADAIQALSFLPSAQGRLSMFFPLLSSDSPDLVRQVAASSVRRALGQIPDPETMRAALYREARDQFLGRKALSGDRQSTVQLWNWDEPSQKLVSRELAADMASEFLAAHRAAEAFALNPDDADYRQLYLLTQLQFGKLTSGVAQPLDQPARQRFTSTFSVGEVERALEQALRTDHVPAAIGACELLAEIGDVELVKSADGRPGTLIRAIEYGDPRLSFAAAQTIAALDPQQPFPGLTTFLDALVYAAGSDGRKKVLIGHTQADQAQTLGAVAELAGYEPVLAISGRDFFQRAVSDPDLELLVVSDFLAHPDYAELIQQLRRNWRSRRIPILLAVRSENMDRGRRIAEHDPLVQSLPWTIDPALLARFLERTRQTGERQPTTGFERMGGAVRAGQYLANIAANRQRYPFYDLSPYSSKITQWLETPGLADVACQLLGSLASPSAQRELVQFAGQPRLPLDQRQAAADAFARAVQHSGLLLTTGEIQAQYDLYNTQARDSAESRAVLGSILNTIEGK